MKTAAGSIMEVAEQINADAVAFSIPGRPSQKGFAFMKKGVAAEVSQAFGPQLSVALGTALQRRPFDQKVLVTQTHEKLNLRAIAVKTRRQWFESALLEDIKKAVKELVVAADRHNLQNVVVVRFGTGYGQLDKTTIHDILASTLDDRFTLAEWNPEEPISLDVEIDWDLLKSKISETATELHEATIDLNTSDVPF